MLEFLRVFRPILDRTVKVRLVVAAVVAVLLSLFDFFGVILILPLVQTLDGLSTDKIPASAGFIADRLSDPTAETVAIILALMVFAAFILKAVFAILYLRWSFHFLAASEANTSKRLLRGYLSAPWTFHLERNSGELLHTANGATGMAFQGGLAPLVGTFADITVLIGVVAVLIVVDVVAAVVIGIYLTVIALVYRRILLRRASRLGEAQTMAARRTFVTAHQSLSAAKEIIVRHREDYFAREYGEARDVSAHTTAALQLLNFAPRYYLEVALIVGVAITGAVVSQTETATQAVAVLAVFLAAGFRALPSVNRLVSATNSVRSSLPALELVAADVAHLRDVPIQNAGDTEQLPPQALVFDDVSFSYERSPEPVLHELSFTIEPATEIAFVGLSGAGKTTLLDLFIGLLEPTSGAITVGGRPLAEVRVGWQLGIGYVPQSVTLLDDTIRANIAFGYEDDEVDEERLLDAVRQAQLDPFVAALPEGLLTHTGEQGVRVSGGQSQRIGIARALYHRPTTLVLDEATSSLDSHTERLITDTVDSLHGDLTIITVSHRLSTVRHADVIHFIEHGHIVGSGTFAELCETTPAFAHLATLQGLTEQLA